jgi:hypothetical protein
MELTQHRIDELGKELKDRIARRKEDLSIALSIPGIGFTSAFYNPCKDRGLQGLCQS